MQRTGEIVREDATASIRWEVEPTRKRRVPSAVVQWAWAAAVAIAVGAVVGRLG